MASKDTDLNHNPKKTSAVQDADDLIELGTAYHNDNLISFDPAQPRAKGMS